MILAYKRFGSYILSIVALSIPILATSTTPPLNPLPRAFPLPLFNAILPLATTALISLIVSLPSALEVLKLKAITVPDITPNLPLATILFAFLFFVCSIFLLAF
jgi:hypothetical protein